MQDQNLPPTQPAIIGWFQELLRGPVAPMGDYFVRLQGSVEASAPECPSCI